MAVVMFGGMCIYNDANRLRWRNITIEPDGNSFHLYFEKRENAQYRQGNRVTVAAATEGPVCPLILLRMMIIHTGGVSDDAFVIRGFNGRLVRRSQERTSPGDAFITYGQFTTCLSLWFGGVMGVPPSEFLSLYESQSGCSGAASTTSNAGIPLELWGQQGDWKSAAAQPLVTI